jgi:hypothetical protein
MNKTLVLDTHAEPLPAREALLLMLEPSSFDTINAENHTFALPYGTRPNRRRCRFRRNRGRCRTHPSRLRRNRRSRRGVR